MIRQYSEQSIGAK